MTTTITTVLLALSPAIGAAAWMLLRLIGGAA